jgi:sigma-B regulation protein RsbU (phosphoserine phosphatase)
MERTERTAGDAVERRIESLTVNLLECYEELDLVYRLSRTLKSTLDAEQSARLILGESRDIFGAEMGFIVPGDGAAACFPTLLEGTAAGTVERLAGPVLAELARRGRSQIFHPAARELGVPGEGLPDALMCAAVRTENARYGALCVGRGGQAGLFTARDLKLADVLASQAALAIEHAVLQRRWREEEQSLIRMAEELRLAREIQSNLLPARPPAVPGYDIACSGLPARSVGGDYYDFIPLEGGRLALCVADVSGKGMPAALLMANLQATIRSQALAGASPSECARRSNRLLFHSTDARRFITCFYGLLDLASGRFDYSNAGHDRPLVVRPDGTRALLDAGGLLLGVTEEHRYDEGTVGLEPGDLLILYSDGITEALDPDDRMFGLEGLEATIARARPGTAQEIVDGVIAAVSAHARGRAQADDMTLVVLRRL